MQPNLAGISLDGNNFSHHIFRSPVFETGAIPALALSAPLF